MPYPPRRRFTRTLLLALLFCFSAGVAPLTAADDKNANDAEKKTNDEVGINERVVVTATRTETPLRRVASTVTVITAEEIQRRQYRFVTDVLRDIPGVDVRQDGGVGSRVSIFIRGADSDHTLVLLDGVELNDPAAPSRLAILSSLTTDGIERIEVLRGPQSTLYGADAIGGVIQIFTRRGAGAPTTIVSGEGGSFSTGRGSVQVAGGNKSLSYSVAASYSDLDGFSASSTGTEDDGYRNATGSASIRWSITDQLDIDVVARFSDDRVDFDGFSAEENHFIDGRMELLKIQPRLSLRDGRWEQEFSLQEIRHERDTTSAFPSRVRGELRTVSWQNEVKVGSSHDLVLGLEGEEETARFDSFKADATNVAIFAQDAVKLGEHGFATFGLRYDDHSEYGGEATYRATGGYEFESGTTIRGSAGTGFKAPALLQLNPLGFGGNQALSPERSRGYDVGVDQLLRDGRVLFGVTVFYNRIDDLIIPVFDPGSGTFLNLNIDEARTQGVEAYIDAQPLTRLGFGFSYTFTDTEAIGTPAGFGLTEGSDLLRRPRHKASVEVHGRLLDGDLVLSLGGRYVGSRADIDPVTFSTTEAASYEVYRVAASWRLTPIITVTARIENLLDEEYEDVLGFSTADRSGYFGLRLTLPSRSGPSTSGLGS